ncbi:hypothetical protein DUGA6_63750 [Duganella sp. HH105]|nr:hypothetical protein DUGA6_63750 [Duganella sp. HH105]
MPHRTNSVGVFFNANGERRSEFQSCCGEMFSQLTMTEHVEAAADQRANTGQLAQLLVTVQVQHQQIHRTLAECRRGRAGAPVLVLCAYEHSACSTACCNSSLSTGQMR